MVSVYRCPSCEEKIKYGCNYCQNCGVKLEWEDDKSDTEDLSKLSEDELVTAYGRDEIIPDGSIKYGVAASGGSLVGGFIIEGLVKGMSSFYSGDLGVKEIKLCHSKTRLYGIAPNKKHDEIDVALKDISIDYHPVSGSDFGDFVIKIPSKEKVYVYHNVYMPNRFYKSIMSAKSGKFDKSIYQSGLKDLSRKSEPNGTEEESDEFDDF